MRIPSVPVSASSVAEWTRRAGEAINRLIGTAGGIETRLAQAEADIEATDADLDAVEADLDAARADIVALQTAATAPADLRGMRLSSRIVSASPLIADDDFAIGIDASAGVVTALLPPATVHPGRLLSFRKIDATANVVTIEGSGADTIDGAPSRTLAVQWAGVTLIAAPSGWWVV